MAADAPSGEWQQGAFADFLALSPGDRPDRFASRRHQPNSAGALYGGMALCQALQAAQERVAALHVPAAASGPALERFAESEAANAGG